MLRRLVLTPLLLVVLAGHVTAKPRPKVLLIAPTNESGRQLSAAEEALSSSGGYSLVLLQALVTPMRAADVSKKVRTRASALEDEGRKAQLGMDYTAARDKFTAALGVLSGGFVRYYDPRALAQIRLLLGSLALNKARPDLAREQFVKALHLDPSLRPDAHHSPQVRKAFSEAVASLPPRPEPPAADVVRVARMAGAAHAVVLGVQPVGDQSLLKGALVKIDKGSYSPFESTLADPKDPNALRQKARRLGLELRKRLEVIYPLPKAPPTTRPFVKNGKKNGKHVPPPPRPWYLRWYTFVAAGAVVATAIILPLALSEEHVGLNVALPPKPKNAP